MAKDSFWFKHDANAGRGGRMRKMAFLHGHWGKGIYWDVIEHLRDQDNYRLESDEMSLRMLSDIIGCKEPDKFIQWFNDCIRLKLLQCNKTHFFSEKLIENMEFWEIKKINGSKGGRPKKNLNETEKKPNQNLNNNPNESIIEQNRIEQNRTEQKKENLIESFFTDLPNSSEFESISRIQGIPKDLLLTQIPVFRKHAELSYPTFQKFTNHFKNWVKLNPPKDPQKPKMVY